MTLNEAIAIGVEAGQLLDAEYARGNKLLTATEAVDRIVAQRARRISTAAAPARPSSEGARETYWIDFTRRQNEAYFRNSAS